jgi:hypothetical protein
MTQYDEFFFMSFVKELMSLKVYLMSLSDTFSCRYILLGVWRMNKIITIKRLFLLIGRCYNRLYIKFNLKFLFLI